MDSLNYVAPSAALSLFGGDRATSDYFFSLPKDVQRGINERAGEIRSAEDLRNMAELLSKKA